MKKVSYETQKRNEKSWVQFEKCKSQSNSKKKHNECWKQYKQSHNKLLLINAMVNKNLVRVFRENLENDITYTVLETYFFN